MLSSIQKKTGAERLISARNLLPQVNSLVLPVILLLPLTCLLLLSSCGKGSGDQISNFPIREFEKHLDHTAFLNPPSAYRCFPFYSLNGELTVEEISRQVRGFREAGFGGFYLHGRTGLLTEYLGEDWWKVLDAAVKTAEKNGLHAWFYDEYNWPSGTGGGAVPRMDPAFRVKCLARLRKETPVPEGSLLLAEDESYRYIEYTTPLGQDLFYGSSYVDLMNPEAVRAFIRVAYQPYTERYQRSFGIFTDEPHIHARYFDRSVPHAGVLTWSPTLVPRFAELSGMDLLENLPLLFEERGNWREIRLYYYRAVASQFEESFTRQIAFFCAEHENVFTGHFLGEDVLQKVRDRIGNAMMHYRNMQQPGMDHLGLTIRGRLITARSLSSVANQYGIPRRLSEIFGISGQNMNFEDRKWLAGWHVILGVNHFCPHLSLYSMEGLRKRDYPPTFSYHQPYWKDNKALEDYLGRISYAATIGIYDPQFLVINPLESEYIKGKGDGEFSTSLLRLTASLQEAHYDYDLGDEQILSDTAFIRDGRLKVGAMAYRNVILPDMIELRKSTVDLLLSLAGEGGKLFCAGRFPEFVDGERDSVKLDSLRGNCTRLSEEKLAETLHREVPARVRLEGENAAQVWSQVRRTEGGSLILLCNISRTEPARIRVSSELLDAEALLWIPSEGMCYSLTDQRGAGYELEIPSASLVWISEGEQAPKPLSAYRLPPDRKVLLSLDGPWQGRRLQPNVITLDFASYSVDGGIHFSDPEPVIGIESRFANQHYTGRLNLRYPVQIDDIPRTCSLVVENPAMYDSIKVNGKKVEFGEGDFYLDHHFRSTDIGGLVAEGINNIEMELAFVHPGPGSEVQEERYGTEIESLYLTGDFSVEGQQGCSTLESQRNATGDFQPRPVHGFKSFALGEEKKVFEGDLTPEGYPFYAGEFEMIQQFELEALEKDRQYFLELPNTEAIVCRVELNGKPAGSLYWSPFRLDITEYLKPGSNTLKITLVNSLRNLLGPHHHPRAELTRVGPNSFTGAGGFPDPSGDRNWYNLRRDGRDLKLWTDTYYNIPFGFLEPVRITVTGGNIQQ